MKFTVNFGNVTFENLTEKDVLYVQSLCEDYARKAHILPRPVIRDGKGNFTSSYTCYDWIMKLQEEITETICCSSTQERAHELVDVITVCTSWLENLGYDERKRLELFSKVNVKNEKRGYFSKGVSKMKRRKSQSPKVLVIKDRYGREWTTKEGLKSIRGVYVLDFKKYFYELVRRNEK